VVEIYGPESGGKTTLALHVVAEAQRSGGVAAFVDAEHALDPTYAKALGVDVDEVGLGGGAALVGQRAGAGGWGVVDDGAAVAEEERGFELLAGEAVEAGAVAADVLGPVVPVGVALQLDALAQDEAGGLAGEALQEWGEDGVEDAALVGACVLARFLRDEAAGVGAEGGRAAEAHVDRVPAGEH
jgi:hypothetical protein